MGRKWWKEGLLSSGREMGFFGEEREMDKICGEKKEDQCQFR